MEQAHILLVSGNTDYTAHLVERLLPEGGYRVTLSGDQSPPGDVDLVLVDLDRVLVSPLAGLKAQRRMGCEAPALLLAPRLSEGMAAEIFELNVREFLTKPATDDNLLDKIGVVLEQTDQERGQRRMGAQLKELDEVLKRHLNELDTLSRIGRVLTTVDDVDTVLTRIVDAAVYLARAQEGALFLADEAGKLYLRAEKNLGQRQAQILSTLSQDSIAAQVYQTGEPVISGSGHTDELKVKTGYLVRALVNVPIVNGPYVIGVLAAYNHGDGPFEETDVTTLTILADYAALALGKAESVATLSLRVDDAAEASRKVFYHTDEMDSPLEAIQHQLEYLLSGQTGPLSETQSDALHRVRLATVRLREISQSVRKLTEEFRPEPEDLPGG